VQTDELELAALYPGLSVEAARNATGWPLKVAEHLETLPAPALPELEALRELEARTTRAHAQPVSITLPTSP
jgi:glutaconate CoA-transferase subunit B